MAEWTTKDIRDALVRWVGGEIGSDFDRWLAAHDTEEKAVAWNEGWDAAVAWMCGFVDYPSNPYELTED